MGPDSFRFDFTHFAALKPEELSAVEEIVNSAIRENMQVCTSKMKLDEARSQGAMALFGEKYSETVRAVSVMDSCEKKPFSMELCGGTHAKRTGDIGFFKIISESSIASGTRRIEAVVGSAAEKHVRQMERILEDASYKLKGTQTEIPSRIDRIINQQKELDKEIKKLKSQIATGGSSKDIMKDVKDVGGIKVLATRISDVDIKSLRSISDSFRSKLGSGVVLIANTEDEKLSFVVSVTQDLVKSGINAGKIAKRFASLVGGSGGGKPDFAQGGGKDISKLDAALAKLPEIISATYDAE